MTGRVALRSPPELEPSARAAITEGLKPLEYYATRGGDAQKGTPGVSKVGDFELPVVHNLSELWGQKSLPITSTY